MKKIEIGQTLSLNKQTIANLGTNPPLPVGEAKKSKPLKKCKIKGTTSKQIFGDDDFE